MRARYRVRSDSDRALSLRQPSAAQRTLNANSGDRFQRLGNGLGGQGFGINLIVLQPGQRGRIHRHERRQEVYLVLDGELVLGVEGEVLVVSQGQVVWVGSSVRRQLVNKQPDQLVLLALGGSGEHAAAGPDGLAWESWDEPGDGRRPRDIPAPADRPLD